MYKPADLPLNERGAVYHLDLLPEELADTLFTVGDPERVKQVSQHFDSIEVTRTHREFVTHTGYIGQKRISVLSTGIGIPNIDIVMNELDALVNIDLQARTPLEKLTSLKIIRLGTTGGLHPNCKPGDIFVSRFGVGFDSLLEYYQPIHSGKLNKMYEALSTHLDGEGGPFYVAESNESLFHQFSQLGKPSITATCGGFYGPQGRQLRVPLTYPNLLNRLVAFEFEGYKIYNFEMETSGILALGQLMGHHCLSISSVLANRITGEFTAAINGPVEQLINRALSCI